MKASAVDFAPISMKKLPSLMTNQQRCSCLRTSTNSSTAASLPVVHSAALMQNTSSKFLTARRWKDEAADRRCLWVQSAGPYMGLIRGYAAAGAADSADLPRLHTAGPLQPQSSLLALLSFISFFTAWIWMWVSHWKYYSYILSQSPGRNKYS